MITKADMADTLEKAADLYEAEKYDWCESAWFVEHEKEPVSAGDVMPVAPISVCASTALALACDLSLTTARDMETTYLMLRNDQRGLVEPALAVPPVHHGCPHHAVLMPPGCNKYFLVREQVDRHLKIGGSGLPAWNDDFDNTVDVKAEVIELFKEVAKDLRNEQ